MLLFLAGRTRSPASRRHTAMLCLPSGVSSHQISSSWR